MLKRLSLPIQLIAVLIFVVILGKYLNDDLVRFFYTFSLAFKELLGAFLPFIVFFFISAGVLSFKKNAPVVLLTLLSFVVVSNVLVSLFSYGMGRLSLPILTDGISKSGLASAKVLTPFYSFTIPSLISSENAMLLAIFVGILFSFISVPAVEKFVIKGKALVGLTLNRFFIPPLPIYVLGFLLKVNYEGVFSSLFESYGKAFGLMVALHMTYLFFMYLVARGFRIKEALSSIKVSAVSYLTAFSTMSSTATIPVTVNCGEKNTGNRSLAALASPIMANVHLIGDGISTPVLSLVTMSLFLGVVPGLFLYLKFVFYFCITMLATSGVPGGGIIVMMPILKSILGFTPEMISIITTLYLLQDSFGTAANVMGDGALMIIVNNWLKRFKII